MTSRKYTLKIPSQTDNLEIIRDFIYKIAEKNGLSDEIAGSIELAVDEACTNVIKHAYSFNEKENVRITVNISSKKITISIVDKGSGFNPETFKINNIDSRINERKSSGYGIYLMQKLMDEVDFDIHPDQKNEVRLIKYLK
jgi:serine/threonine-protein kinase RsbW